MQQLDEQSLFLDAIELPDAAAQQAWVRSVCRSNSRLCSAVLRLLDAHHRPENVLDQPAAPDIAPQQSLNLGTPLSTAPDAAAAESLTGTAGSRYRLMEKIGEGGFGIVYVAQQETPVKRLVAIKMIRPGMNFRDITARFEAERQALALMDHHSISRVFDAGSLSDGRPFFAMELVRGVPVTEFCDTAGLSLPHRLELFEQICHAVHYAHQKGIIHRDIKPSNLLASHCDDRPMVKVIDFGIARAVGQTLTDRTLYTRFMAMMGTPQYMSPEQAEVNNLDVDIRSDIYSLGVVLYELLTGTTPVEKIRVHSAGLHELRRMIVEEEAPRPSARLSTMENRRTTAAGKRSIVPSSALAAIRGDLDWIVMKAIEKDRSRRYQSAADLARDVRRYLNGDPIEARPPSPWYRLRKIAARHRLALAAGSIMLLSLVTATAVSWVQKAKAVAALEAKDQALRDAVDAREQANEARSRLETFSQRLVDASLLLSSAQSELDNANWGAARDTYTEAIRLQSSWYLPWQQRAQMYVRLNLWEEASLDFANAVALGAPTSGPQWHGSGPLLALFKQHESLRQLCRQDLRRLLADNSEFDWQALRNCLALTGDDPEVPWKAVADKAEQTLAEMQRDPRSRMFGREPGHDHGREAGRDFRGEPGREPRGEQARSRDRSFDSSREAPRDAKGEQTLPRRRPSQRPPGPDEQTGPRGFSEGQFPGMPARRDFRLPQPLCQYLTGLSRLRSGELNEARRWLELAANSDWEARDIAFSPLALACNRAGDTTAAAEWLQKSSKSMEAALQPSRARLAGLNPARPWFDSVEGLLYYRLAATEILQSGDDLIPLLQAFHTAAAGQIQNLNEPEPRD